MRSPPSGCRVGPPCPQLVGAGARQYATGTMSPLRHLLRSPLLRALLCVELALRTLMPVGVMVSGDVGHGLEVQLCTAQGLQTLWLPGEPAAPAQRSGSGHADTVCAFSLAAGATLAAADALISQPVTSVAWIAARGTTRDFLAAIRRAHSPRAPPVQLPV